MLSGLGNVMSLRCVLQYHSAGVGSMIDGYLDGSTSGPFAKKNISFKSIGLENPSADGHLSVCTVACVLC